MEILEYIYKTLKASKSLKCKNCGSNRISVSIEREIAVFCDKCDTPLVCCFEVGKG